MEQSTQNPNPAPNATANPVPDTPKTNPVANKKKQIRLLILVILLFLASLITNYAILKERAEQQKQAKSFITKSQPQQSSVVLNKEYKNPFDKNAQYVNPFSKYKNPFDSLK